MRTRTPAASSPADRTPIAVPRPAAESAKRRYNGICRKRDVLSPIDRERRPYTVTRPWLYKCPEDPSQPRALKVWLQPWRFPRWWWCQPRITKLQVALDPIPESSVSRAAGTIEGSRERVTGV